MAEASGRRKEPEEEEEEVTAGPSRPLEVVRRKEPYPRLDPVSLCKKAQGMVKEGRLEEAHDLLHLYLTTLPSFEEDLKRVREEGTSERVMVRANYAIVKEALWSTGFAELLFRDALMEGRRLINAAGGSLSSEEKGIMFDESMMQVLKDLGLSWSGRKGFGKLACQALLHVLTFEPKNIYMWTHFAEACVSYLSAQDTGDDYLFGPLNEKFDWLLRPIKDEMNDYAKKLQIWKYCPSQSELLKIHIDWKLPYKALLLAKRLMFINGKVQGDRLLHSQILLLSAYVNLRKKAYFSSLRDARDAVSLEDIPTEHKVLAKFYINIGTVLSQKAGLEMLRPIKISDDDRITCQNPDKLDSLVEILNRKQSYVWVLLLIKSGDVTGAQILAQEHLNEPYTLGCRALVTLLEFMNWTHEEKPEKSKQEEGEEPEQNEGAQSGEQEQEQPPASSQSQAEPFTRPKEQKPAKPQEEQEQPKASNQPEPAKSQEEQQDQEQPAASSQPNPVKILKEQERAKRQAEQEKVKAKTLNLHEALTNRSNIYKETLNGCYKNIVELTRDDRCRDIDRKAIRKFKQAAGAEEAHAPPGVVRPVAPASHGTLMKVIDKTTKKSILIPF